MAGEMGISGSHVRLCLLLRAAYAKQLDASIVKRIDALQTLHGMLLLRIVSACLPPALYRPILLMLYL